MNYLDRIDWHLDAAIEARQPARNAFTHIGFFLVWLIQHDLVDTTYFDPPRLADVKRGAIAPGDLVDDIDGKLFAGALTPEGRGFSDARYGAYTDAYSATFADLGDYAVPDTAENFERIEPVIDALYADWVAAGRPAPDPPTEDELADAQAAWDLIRGMAPPADSRSSE